MKPRRRRQGFRRALFSVGRTGGVCIDPRCACGRRDGGLRARRPWMFLSREIKVADFALTRKVNEEDGSIRNVRAHYLYWWIGAKRSTPSDFERILFTVLDNMFRNINNRWGYPSVMVYAQLEDEMTPDEIKDADQDALKRAIGFVEQYAPMFQKSLGAVEAE